MKTITHLRIVAVDLEAFQGRDHHPEPADVGQVVLVHGMELEIADEDTGERIGVWDCARADGTSVQLVDHEVEITQP